MSMRYHDQLQWQDIPQSAQKGQERAHQLRHIIHRMGSGNTLDTFNHLIYPNTITGSPA